MAAELITPVDELSGIPLSVAPPLERLPRNDPNKANWHHLYHPSTAPQLRTVGGMALRNSRVQLIPPKDHNFGRHTYHTFFTGPVLPETEDEQFRLCVLSCGGYLPDKVIDLKGAEPTVRQMREDEKKAFMLPPLAMGVRSYDVAQYRAAQSVLGRTEEIRSMTKRDIRRIIEERNIKQAAMSYNNISYSYDSIRTFFQQYALKQPLSEVKEIFLDEFLSTTDRNRRRNLGHWILAKQAEVAADVVRESYAAAYSIGALHPGMPAEPSSLIKFKLGNSGRREQLFGRLDDAIILAGAAS